MLVGGLVDINRYEFCDVEETLVSHCNIHYPQVRYPITDDIQLHDNLVYEALHLLEEGVSVILAPDGADDITVLHRLLAPKGITQVCKDSFSSSYSRVSFITNKLCFYHPPPSFSS